jgi:DNA repair protein RadC
MLSHAQDSREDRVSDTDTADADHIGHRDRLRTRFLAGGADSLQDYEMLELLLFTALPRRDVKPLAKALLRNFGSLWCVLNAPPDALRKAFPKLTEPSPP